MKQYINEFGYNLRLALPIILSMLGHTLVGVIDTAMVGKVGTLELAAASLGNSYVFLLMSFGIGFSTVITTLTAESVKKHNTAETKSILTHGLLINTLLGVIIFAGLFLSKPLMLYTQQKEEVIALAVLCTYGSCLDYPPDVFSSTQAVCGWFLYHSVFTLCNYYRQFAQYFPQLSLYLWELGLPSYGGIGGCGRYFGLTSGDAYPTMGYLIQGYSYDPVYEKSYA